MTCSSFESTPHHQNFIQPILKRDLETSRQSLPLRDWVPACLGVSSDVFKSWERRIKEKKWFNDTKVNKALQSFCEQADERSRYKPFCEMGNRVLALARDKRKGLPEFRGKKYPIPDITFECNDPRILQVNPLHGDLGAQRKPDVVAIRAADKRYLKPQGKAKKPPGLKWTSILLFVEFKEETTKKPITSPRLDAKSPRKTPLKRPSQTSSTSRSQKVSFPRLEACTSADSGLTSYFIARRVKTQAA